MNNFEEALERIKELEDENLNLKNKLKAALWKLSSSSVGETKIDIGKQVGKYPVQDAKDVERIEAMQRFTERMKNEGRKFRKERNGENKKS